MWEILFCIAVLNSSKFATKFVVVVHRHASTLYMCTNTADIISFSTIKRSGTVKPRFLECSHQEFDSSRIPSFLFWLTTQPLKCFFFMVFICSVVSKICVFSVWCLFFSCILPVREDILPSILLASLWKRHLFLSTHLLSWIMFFLSIRKCSTGLILSTWLICFGILPSWCNYWRYLRILPKLHLVLEVLDV